ncbi:hypothetical protein HMPREF9022_01247, partial [Erysipelotrichaceae bacterium 2_2_44A]
QGKIDTGKDTRKYHKTYIVEKTTYLNTLEYEAKRMKETDLHAASIEAELKKTREEIAAMEIVNGRLQVYRNVAQQEGVRR